MIRVARRVSLPTSFRARFLLVVCFAAVLPLVLIGVWLTRAVVRAGTDLLQSELDQSLQRVAAGVGPRWEFRAGELALLANNDVAGRVLSLSAGATMRGEDSDYLRQLTASVAGSIPSFEYRDATGVTRWSTPPFALDPADARAQTGARPDAGPTMVVTVPVSGARRGVTLGDVVAHVALSSVIAIDTSLRLPNGARLQVVQRDSARALLPAFAPDSVLALNRFSTNGADWLAVHRNITDPGLTLIMAAPLAAYVDPFKQAARTGAVTLAVVAICALMLSAWLTTQLTSSLERLAVAADAVAAGDLHHRVDGNGAGEVGRVAGAFNTMTESLRQTLTELTNRRAFATVGEYASLLAHQVRNGLTAVRVDLQRAQEEASVESPLVDRSLENLERLNDTVTASLRAARSRSAVNRLVDLRAVLRSAVRMADGTFAERGATCNCISAGGAPAWVRGDATALEHLFVNLLLNAAQASQHGAHSDVVLDADAAEWRVVVTDTGAGISAEAMSRVLDPFYSTKVDGTGLGLPIAKQIASAHGGAMRIDSVLGEGTRVEVRLPVAAAPNDASPI
jgi:signal transduction histidine kinase